MPNTSRGRMNSVALARMKRKKPMVWKHQSGFRNSTEHRHRPVFGQGSSRFRSAGQQGFFDFQEFAVGVVDGFLVGKSEEPTEAAERGAGHHEGRGQADADI